MSQTCNPTEVLRVAEIERQEAEADRITDALLSETSASTNPLAFVQEAEQRFYREADAALAPQAVQVCRATTIRNRFRIHADAHRSDGQRHQRNQRRLKVRRGEVH